MKHIRLILGRSALFAFICCNKELKIDPLNVGVTTSKTTYQVGDTVHFNFTGNPDIISFYSGTDGNDYAYKDRTMADGTSQLQFTSYAQYGTQDSSLQLMVSNNFSGTYDSTNVVQATGSDITNRATLATGQEKTP